MLTCFLSVMFSDNNLRAISQLIPQPSITKIISKIINLTFHFNLPGTNELICSPSTKIVPLGIILSGPEPPDQPPHLGFRQTVSQSPAQHCQRAIWLNCNALWAHVTGGIPTGLMSPQCIAVYPQCTGHEGIPNSYLIQPITQTMTPAH